MSSKFWNKQISSAKAYVPGEQPRDKQYIKLNTNELPYPPSPAVQAVLKDFDSSDLRLYPDPSQKSCVQRLLIISGSIRPKSLSATALMKF